jgi:hypothetical protein
MSSHKASLVHNHSPEEGSIEANILETDHHLPSVALVAGPWKAGSR